MNLPPEDPDSRSPAHAAESAQTPSFEDGLAELGRIVTGLESGSLGLADSITAYERGVSLVRRLHDELAQTEARVNVLVRIDEEGHPILAPHAEAGSDPGTARPAKRTARAKASRSRPLPGMDEGSDEA